jgi:hypothetical protein
MLSSLRSREPVGAAADLTRDRNGPLRAGGATFYRSSGVAICLSSQKRSPARDRQSSELKKKNDFLVVPRWFPERYWKGRSRQT